MSTDRISKIRRMLGEYSPTLQYVPHLTVRIANLPGIGPEKARISLSSTLSLGRE
jgi:hypothetical protein